ncbi:MAG: hypothetical protein AAF634_01940 [Bacteroidota bacterium]
MPDNNFNSQEYTSILNNLKEDNYLTKEERDVLLRDALNSNAVVLINVSREKAEIVRRAIFEKNKPKHL